MSTPHGIRSGEVTAVEHGDTLDVRTQPHGKDVVYVEFEKNDPRNPFSFSKSKKWAILLMACFSTLLVGLSNASYNMGFPSMIPELGCTQLQATAGLSLFALGFGLVPLVSASLSEEFGRQPLYVISAIGFALMFLMEALGNNIETILIARFVQGCFASTGSTMVGGTVADIFEPPERGLPMSVFACISLGSTGLGPAFAGWVEMNPRLRWRWIPWILLIISGVYALLVPVVLRETRSEVLLSRIAARKRKETGDNRYRTRADNERPPLRSLLKTSVTRSVRLLLTEPIVLFLSLWVGFAWGVMYVMMESISDVFEQLHGFNQGEVGLVFLATTVGPVLGLACNFVQERLYEKYSPMRGVEARLYQAIAGAWLAPIAMFIYAWTAYTSVNWIAQAIAIALFMWATFTIFVSSFVYTADCYGIFASSALAGNGLLRNLMGMAFPLFTHQMYDNLGYQWANTMFAFIAMAMVPIPVVLFKYGPRIRAHSPFCQVVMAQEARQSASAKYLTSDAERGAAWDEKGGTTHAKHDVPENK
ncbi:MFS general substrate transporter [Fistulina hepatica ATCC 64428]|uniref:MFS general substrate transporter n=1 Tax=Fistulina hepatica ATCC 64428 TaxID=1128425 RepID=A0A0D7AQK8_9AGAR|nr:MFS general substrate transporter [Fistulina hepatica ATCC 64428]